MTMFGARKWLFVHLDHAASQSGRDGSKTSVFKGPVSGIMEAYCQKSDVKQSLSLK